MAKASYTYTLLQCTDYIRRLADSKQILVSYLEPTDACFPFATNSNLPYLFHGPSIHSSEVNQSIAQLQSDGHVELFNLNNILSIDTDFDFKNYLRTLSPLNYNNIPLIAESIQALLPSSLSSSIPKVVVVDLDNTLWKGVLREDGSDGIIIGGQTSLGRVYEYLQTLLLHLKNCGLLLCICSKNYQTDVLEVFKTNKSLLLAADDFVLIKCSDRPKSEMIREISCELNISYDQFLFLDDSKHERDEVSTNLPGIVVPDLPNDIFQWPLYLLNNQKFQLILNTYNAPDNRSEKYKTRISAKKALIQ